MIKEAVLHIPLSQYAYAENANSLIIRIRTAKDDVKECLLFYGDRVDPEKNVRMKVLTMEKIGTDDLFDYFEAAIRDRYTRVCYYFCMDDGEKKTYYYERGFCDEIDCVRTEYFQFPYIRKEDIVAIPEWAKEIVMYHVFPDSFASKRRELSECEKKIIIEDKEQEQICSANHHGGTLCGVIENVDYLKALGVNCIYLNPIFAANSYHKYDTIDYFSVDPCFGTMEDLKAFVEKCHENGIRVLLDGVFNHCGPDFFAFRDVLEHGKNSRYYNWFYDMPEPVVFADPPNYEAFAYVKEMPKLNTGNPEVEKYLIRVGTYWMEEAGIDGWRLDVANEINHDFWRHFRSAVRAVRSDALLIGEIWEDAGIWLQGDQFDSTMNYRFSYLCKDFFAERKLSVSEFDAQIHKMILRYPYPVALAQMNFLDSHDVPRFLSYCNGNRRRMELAFFYLFVAVGIPSVFYGDEYYLMGTEEPEYRQSMPWGSEDNCCDQFSQWMKMRRMHPALTQGNYRTVCADDENGVYGFTRSCETETLLILLNNSDTEQAVDIGRILPEHTTTVRNQVVLGAMSGGIYPVSGLS